MFGNIAGTAAGVAAGTVIGDKISGRNEPTSSHDVAVNNSVNPCRYEEEQILNCIKDQTDLQACELIKKTFMDCKHKYNIK
ncbi:PREDICTED: coiled-coil-helix-coiled-coil-helix domain-containing protein 10, mitochondrial-like [Polistes canadensis]|uniref:coiled-coil-helix-coiled-coil-helix domain-containing protein 10, mitochondrial-like n=1 Tax=Polistes canadensis TaxID=91411 RepID=UPI00071904BF|nr:PREDICTED: coiled-coil-helix-coiled-coil-helix domain-containing protein 10, mitochondrial-like [Polistes canadensis]